MEQIFLPQENANRFIPNQDAEPSKDFQNIANLYGLAIDDLEIILFQKGHLVDNFIQVTDDERDLIKNTEVSYVNIIKAIDKEIALIESGEKDKWQHKDCIARLKVIGEKIKSSKRGGDASISLQPEEMNFLHEVFNSRFENILKKINDLGRLDLAS